MSGPGGFHRWLLIALVAAAPVAALPIFIGPLQFPITELLFPLAAASVVIERWRGRGESSLPQPRGSELWPIGLFLIAALLSLLVSEYPRQSLRELRLLIVEPVALYVLLRMAPLDVRWAHCAAIALVTAATVLAIVAIGIALSGRGLVEAEGVYRLRGLFPSANHFALMLGRAIPFSLALALSGGPRWPMIGATMILGASLVGTFSGGGWMGTAAAVLVVIWLSRGTSFAVGLLALGGALGTATLLFARSERIASRIDPTRGTAFIRIQLWEASLAMLRDHPLLGIGLDNFLYRYQQDYLPDEAAMEPNLSHPHNWLLNFWLSLGLLGLVAALWLLLQFMGGIRDVLRRFSDPTTRALAIGAAGSMVSFLVHGSVDNFIFLPDMALLFWFTLAIPRILNQQQSRVA